MIKKILSRLMVYDKVLRTLDHNLIAISSNGNDEMCLQQILKMFDKNFFFPLTSWSISPKEIVHICNDIVINNRKNIVEFGAGFSTVCIAQLLKINNINSKFISVESDEKWAKELNSYLEKENLQDFATVVFVPIVEVASEFLYKEQKTWYDTSLLNELLKDYTEVDLFIVDGPFGGSTKFARYSALPFLKNNLADNFAFFLDDYRRPEEKEFFQEWKKIMNFESHDLGRYVYSSKVSGFDIDPYHNVIH